MGLFDRKKDDEPPPASKALPVAFGGSDDALRLYVLFTAQDPFDENSLRAAMRASSPQFASASVNLYRDKVGNPNSVSRVTWGVHHIDIIVLGETMRPSIIDRCTSAAFHKPDMGLIVGHRSQARLNYSGNATDSMDQYVALLSVAGGLASLGMIAVLNLAAFSAMSVPVLQELAAKEPDFFALRRLPLFHFYCGFRKSRLRPVEGAWFRTYNCPAFGLPDLAMWRASANQADETFDLFNRLLLSAQSAGRSLAPGHTVRLDGEQFRFHAPRDDAPFDTITAGRLLIVESDDGDGDLVH